MRLLTTELDAVNIMLSAIGESPLNALDDSFEEADLAQRILSETNRELQSQKLSFNTYYDYELKKNINDEYIYIPDNTLRVKQRDQGDFFIQRGNRLFDRGTNTFDFESNVNVEITLLLDFEETPEPFRYYTAIRSRRKFQERAIGSNTLFNFTLKEEEDARIKFADFESEAEDVNVFDNGLGDLSNISNR